MKLNMSDVGTRYPNPNEIWKITDMFNFTVIQILYKSITEKESHPNKWNIIYSPIMSRYCGIIERTY